MDIITNEMKQAILTTFIWGFISFSCFSQMTSNLNSNSPALASTINSLQYSLKPLDYKFNQHPSNSFNIDKYLKVQTSKTDKILNLKNNFAFTEDQNTFYNMPCLKPEFKSNMPVFKPDSTITHTLLIKKIR